jgi:catechol 2,3-dioxygenase-like lactoylglutathione lyase family enzyme
MIDHTGVTVRDYEASKAFYLKTLGAIGYTLLMELPASVTKQTDVAGFGEEASQKPDFWVIGGKPNDPHVHVAFRVERRDLVDAFFRAALEAGGKDNGAPGVRAHYHANYYGAFVLDPDGHNIEAVCHQAP